MDTFLPTSATNFVTMHCTVSTLSLDSDDNNKVMAYDGFSTSKKHCCITVCQPLTARTKYYRFSHFYQLYHSSNTIIIITTILPECFVDIHLQMGN